MRNVSLMSDPADINSASAIPSGHGTLAVIGGGNMGAAIVGGLLAAGWPATSIIIVEVAAPRRAQLAELYPGVLVSETVVPCTSALLAVKPGDIADAASAATAAGARRLLSIAAGVGIAAIESAADDPSVAVVRAMPNTPALVGAGAAAIAGGSAAGDDDLAWAESILAAVGTVVRVPESHLDAVTGVAGSGPAYLFMVAESLIDAAVLAGLPRSTADALVRQLFVGSAALLAQGTDPAVLRANVTSPGGTTAAGLRALEAHAVRAAFTEAVMAATRRSVELGDG
jgi:pyrroline-5-carboxylate reductase